MSKTILDFGAGYRAIHTSALRALGLNTTAHDIGRNFDPYVHADNALTREFDVVMASNVINTHATEHALNLTVAQMARATKADGVCVCNYPDSPRKGPWSVKQIEFVLLGCFASVEFKRINGTACFFCRRPMPTMAWANDGFTAQELDTCNIRPNGAVGSKALVPRIVVSMLQGGDL